MLLCVGSPIIDYITDVDNDPSFLKKYQLESDGAVKADYRHEKLFEDILGLRDTKVVPAGSVTNTARVFRWISKKGEVMYVGAIGKDKNGRLIKLRLDSENVPYRFLERKTEMTGRCAALISVGGKYRSLVTDLGAGGTFRPEDLNDNLWETINKCTMIYISELLVLCETLDIIGQTTEELLEKFYCAFTDETSNTEKILVFTADSKPVVTRSRAGLKYFPVGVVDNIVDTNACGDSFAGGFLAKTMERCSLEECVRCGLWCAAVVIRTMGCEFETVLEYEQT
ncbi:adenosine kinase-like isoform X2 [Cylas formicarius]|uniref:adenosine kinase-like isoform X2 n=1 Tax=Cylas formicarius TaxID=197179 RepID=UPI002958B912|nr:adenosine kinase-like isoform X2 [Cylas formicarius]